MSILTKLKLASHPLKGVLNQPDNVTLRRMFPDGVPFKSRKSVVTAAIIEKTNSEQHKLAYVLGEEVIAALKPSDYQVKDVNVIGTVDGKTRLILTNPRSNNSWVTSNIETLGLSVDKPVSVVRDYDAKVYVPTVHHDHENFELLDEAVEDVINRVFEGYYIQSLDHPMVRDLVKKDSGCVVVVDENQPDDPDAEKAMSSEIVEPIKTTGTEDDGEVALEIPDMDMDMSLDDLNL
ncbi:hypothetical protein ACP3V3_21430 [Vibrio sp. PNB22_3_1]